VSLKNKFNESHKNKAVTRNKIITGIGIIIGLTIISGITFACWQYHQDKEFDKKIECQKLGKDYYYNPAANECLDGNYCVAHPNNYWCKE